MFKLDTILMLVMYWLPLYSRTHYSKNRILILILWRSILNVTIQAYFPKKHRKTKLILEIVNTANCRMSFFVVNSHWIVVASCHRNHSFKLQASTDNHTNVFWRTRQLLCKVKYWYLKNERRYVQREVTPDNVYS